MNENDTLELLSQWLKQQETIAFARASGMQGVSKEVSISERSAAYAYCNATRELNKLRRQLPSVEQIVANHVSTLRKAK